MPGQVEERLSRFLFHKDDFAAQKGIVRWRASIPDGNGQTSVAEVTGLALPGVLELSRTVSRFRGLDARGHAIFPMRVLPPAGLEFVRDDHPFERHGNLIGWPLEPGPAGKARRMNIAQQLSSAATLVTYGESSGASNEQN